MTIHQLSVFIENQSGTLIKVLELLKEADIQLIAVSIADTTEYGIFRVVCCEPMRAYEALKAAGIAVAISEIFAIEMDNTPGSAADVIKSFSQRGVSIAYLYSFVLNGKGVLIFRTDNSELANSIAREQKLKLLSDDDLVGLNS